MKGERNLDQRSDLYSLGVVLYEMLCGRPPFESRSQFELMMAHVNQAPAPPSSVQAKVPQALDAVVLRALAKDPADRYPSAAAFADAIAGFNAEAVQAGASAVTESLPVIVPELAVSGEPEPATTSQVEPAEVVAESAVLELESAGEPTIVEDAAPIVEVGASAEPAVEAVPGVRAGVRINRRSRFRAAAGDRHRYPGRGGTRGGSCARIRSGRGTCAR